MKLSLSLLALSVFLAPSAFARDSMCDDGFTEVSQCVADATIPFFPFVSICKNAGGAYQLMMDEGAGTTPGAMDVAKSETAASVVFTATGDDTDSTVLTYAKAANVKAELTYNAFGFNAKSSYTCNTVAE